VGLLGSIPRLDGARGDKLTPIRGSVRDVLPWPEGCAFAPRCDHRIDACVGEPPGLTIPQAGRAYRCLNPVFDQRAGVSPARKEG
jgi:peptide/nickel transport system ATP-binding protein